MPILQSNIDFLWNTVVLPRLGTTYTWGTFDCSMAVSQELEAMVYGPAMTWDRQFTTMSFAGVNPGDTGPFQGIAVTTDLVCIAAPTDAPPDAAMIIAIIQNPDSSEAHMICRVGGIDIEMGGDSNNYHTSVSDPTCASVMNADEFDQWLYLPGPITGAPLPGPLPRTYTVASGDTLSSIAVQLGVSLSALETANPQITDDNVIYVGEVINVPAPVPLPSPPTGSQGLDYAGGIIPGAAIKAAGYQFVCRYVSDGGSDMPDKLLTSGEAGDLRAAGIDIVSNFESTGTSAKRWVRCRGFRRDHRAGESLRGRWSWL